MQAEPAILYNPMLLLVMRKLAVAAVLLTVAVSVAHTSLSGDEQRRADECATKEDNNYGHFLYLEPSDSGSKS